MRELSLERYRPAAEAANAAAHALALAAIFLAGALPFTAAFPLALGVAGVGMGIRRLLGSIEADQPREDGAPHRGIAVRLFPIYAFFASTILVMFPEPFGARSLFLLAFAEAPLLGLSTSPRGRTLADVNAALLVAGAASVGGTAARFLVALWLVAIALTLALRHLDERAQAARWEGEEDLTPAFSTAGLAAALLLTIYVLAATLLPLDPSHAPKPTSGADLEKAAQILSAELKINPWRTASAIAGAIILPILTLIVWKKLAEWLRRQMGTGAPRGEDEGEIPLGAPQALEDGDAEAPTLDASTSGRSGVVAAYRKLEAALAARDLGRAPSEGASEHAGHLGERFPAARESLEEVARRFAGARYGPDEPSEGAPRATRAAAERVLREIDREG